MLYFGEASFDFNPKRLCTTNMEMIICPDFSVTRDWLQKDHEKVVTNKKHYCSYTTENDQLKHHHHHFEIQLKHHSVPPRVIQRPVWRPYTSVYIYTCFSIVFTETSTSKLCRLYKKHWRALRPKGVASILMVAHNVLEKDLNSNGTLLHTNIQAIPCSWNLSCEWMQNLLEIRDTKGLIKKITRNFIKFEEGFCLWGCHAVTFAAKKKSTRLRWSNMVVL